MLESKCALITLSGVDGSGKSTQLEMLKAALQAQGLDVHPAWHRPGYSLTLNRARAVVRRLRPQALPTADSAERDKAFSRSWVKKTWVALALIESIAFYAIKLRFIHLRGRFVICDRYVEDAILDLDLRFPELRIADGWMARLLRRLSPTPNLEILLMIPWEVALRRLEQKVEPFPDPPELRRARYDKYLELMKEGRMQVVDAARPAEDVHAELIQLLGSL